MNFKLAYFILPAIVFILCSNIVAQELTERTKIKNQAMDAWFKDDFATLEKLAQEYRQKKSRTSSGVWKLTIFYSAFEGKSLPEEEISWSFLKKKSEKWIKEYPQSPTPYIVHAIILNDYAWKFRGDGWVSSVRDKYWRPFYDNLTVAKAFLEKHKDIAGIDPNWYQLMARIDVGLKTERKQFEKMLEEGLKKEPYFYQTYFNAADYYMPKWYGNKEELEKFANEAVAKTRRQDGYSMYARIYWVAYWGQYTDRLFTDSDVNWDAMKKGIDDVLKKYPDQWNINNFALFACKAKDKQKAKALFRLLKEPVIGQVWDSEEEYTQYRKWANK